MDRTHIARRVRITLSVFCLIVCGLLIALWVRSYYYVDSVTGPIPDERTFVVTSFFGRVMYFSMTITDWWQKNVIEWEATTTQYEENNRLLDSIYAPSIFGFHWRRSSDTFAVGLPYWFLTLLIITLAALPWIKWRFSLRTMLIGMTSVAVICGAIAML